MPSISDCKSQQIILDTWAYTLYYINNIKGFSCENNFWNLKDIYHRNLIITFSILMERYCLEDKSPVVRWTKFFNNYLKIYEIGFNQQEWLNYFYLIKSWYFKIAINWFNIKPLTWQPLFYCSNHRDIWFANIYYINRSVPPYHVRMFLSLWQDSVFSQNL